jgi:hypothetical protein
MTIQRQNPAYRLTGYKTVIIGSQKVKVLFDFFFCMKEDTKACTLCIKKWNVNCAYLMKSEKKMKELSEMNCDIENKIKRCILKVSEGGIL